MLAEAVVVGAADGFDAQLVAEDCRETEIPLKQRDNSAAARLVKLTSADMPPVLVLLRQAARSPPRIQAVLTNGLGSDLCGETR